MVWLPLKLTFQIVSLVYNIQCSLVYLRVFYYFLVIKNSTISYAIASLKGPKDTSDPVETPKDPNDPIPRETTWTNQKLIKKAYLKVTAVFKSSEAPPAPDPTGRNHFVTEFNYGITRGELRLNLIRGK